MKIYGWKGMVPESTLPNVKNRYAPCSCFLLFLLSTRLWNGSSFLLQSRAPYERAFQNVGRFRCRFRNPTSNNKSKPHDSSSAFVSSSESSPFSLSETSRLQKNGGILYRKSIFGKSELDQIRAELEVYQTQMVDETSSSVAVNRIGICLPKDSETNHILRDGSLRNWINTVATTKTETMASSDTMLAGDVPSSQRNPRQYILRDDIVPVEMRSYEKRGACMAWHYDDVLFDPPQLEVIWTLENTSDCVTLWKQKQENQPGKKITPENENEITKYSTAANENNQVHSVETDPNSALIIMAGESDGPCHCVTSLRHGRRIILKCVFALEDAIVLNKNEKNSKTNTIVKRNSKKSKTSNQNVYQNNQFSSIAKKNHRQNKNKRRR